MGRWLAFAVVALVLIGALAWYAVLPRRIDDPAFFEAMIAWFEREPGADRRRVLVTGLSNGGQMAYRLGLERPDLVLAIAAMAVGLPAPAVGRHSWRQQHSAKHLSA